MARSNTISANLAGTGRTATIQNSYRPGRIKTFNSDTESNTKNPSKPDVSVAITPVT